MKVVEIFESIDGEGIRAGYPVTFIRLEGCNLRCSYCDTKYSYENAEYEEKSVNEITEIADNIGNMRITLTGGEPLIHKDVLFLIYLLLIKGYEVNVETNGSVSVDELKQIAKNFQDRLIITMDYKCPTSGMEDKMLMQNLELLDDTDVLKFVVGTEEDLNCIKKVQNQTKAQIFVSPIFGMMQPKEIVRYILNNRLLQCRVQLQMHKYIWDVNERGV